MKALNDFKQAIVKYYKTALSYYDCEIPALLSLSVLNVISVVDLLSQSRVAFNFIVVYFNYSCIFLNFWARSPEGGRGLSFVRGGDARRKFSIKPLKETNLGMAQTFVTL